MPSVPDVRLAASASKRLFAKCCAELSLRAMRAPVRLATRLRVSRAKRTELRRRVALEKSMLWWC